MELTPRSLLRGPGGCPMADSHGHVHQASLPSLDLTHQLPRQRPRSLGSLEARAVGCAVDATMCPQMCGDHQMDPLGSCGLVVGPGWWL